jgi:hypothetical protein
MSAISKFITPAEPSIPAHPLAPKFSTHQNWRISRNFLPEANTRHTESEFCLWKFTVTLTPSQLMSFEDCLLILFGFISGCIVASCFSQILGLFT